jgi:hypothetical protein
MLQEFLNVNLLPITEESYFEKIKNYGFDEEYNILLTKIDSFIYSDDELEI